MNCCRPTVTAVRVSPSPVGINWSSGGDSGTHITALAQTAKQEKRNLRVGKILSVNSSQPADPERSINYEMAKPVWR